jgi:MATE family multidrug resistance protein
MWMARGRGWQASTAAANLGAFYIVSLPAAIALAFVYNLKVIGLCIGLVLGIIFQVAMLGILTDWQKQVEHALHCVYSSANAMLPFDLKQESRG